MQSVFLTFNVAFNTAIVDIGDKFVPDLFIRRNLAVLFFC